MSSIDLKSKSNSRIGLPCVSIYDSSESVRPVGCLFADSCLFPVTAGTMNKVVVHEEDSDSCSSSSIGRNSDISGGSSAGEVDSGEGEVQSSYKGPLDALDALEEVLPIKRGISKFYCGKSKSFTSLGDASSCSSITDIAKPEDSYTRKRKNLLAFNTYFDKNHTNCLNSSTTTTNNIGGNGISKRPANSRSTLSLAMTMAMACFESTTTENSESSNSDSSSPNRCLPPLHPHSRRPTNTESVAASSPSRHKTSPYRSFSLSDLQGASASTIPRITGLVQNNGGNDEDKPCLLLT